jgi:hypothetical protein
MRFVLRLVAFSLLVFGLPILISQRTLAQPVVRVAPPPPVRVGVVGKPPGIGYVWIEGYQRWDGKKYLWVSGRWVRPPRAGAVWVAPTWVRQRNGWVLDKGYWR